MSSLTRLHPYTKATGPSQPTKIEKTRHEVLEIVRDLISKISKLGNLMATAGDHIDKLASCFKHESMAIDREWRWCLR